MEQSKDFLATRPIGRLLLQLSLPTVAAQLINMLYNVVDRIYIGHIPGEGALELTGVGVCMPLILIISAFAALVGNGGAPRASIAVGKKSCSSGCVSGYSSAFYIGISVCCKKRCSYTVKTGVVTACTVGGVSCDIYIIKSNICS